MSEWKLVDVEGIGSGYACLTLDGVSTTKSRNLIQADRGAGSAQKHFHTDATTGRRCESAFALLSHKKVTKRLWTADSYGKIGVVGYRLLQERDG